jgi:hypothetical protein
MSDKKEVSTEVAPYEEVMKELAVITDKHEVHLPVSSIFGRGELALTESFGGRTLAQNAELVDEAFENTNELQNIWNRSHSQWDWKHINLSYHGDMKNVRQIAAEMSRKKMALDEAKWRQLKNEVKLRKLEEKLASGTADKWKEIDIKIQIGQAKEGNAQGMAYIEGAMKDVLALNELYEEMKDRFEGFTEADFEKQESKSHLKRSLVQCIRDVRQQGAITKGEQEYLEQIGVNPTKMQARIRQYVAEEEASADWSTTALHEFVSGVVDELIDVLKVDRTRMELMGFNPDHLDYITHDKSVAHKSRLEYKFEGEE